MLSSQLVPCPMQSSISCGPSHSPSSFGFWNVIFTPTGAETVGATFDGASIVWSNGRIWASSFAWWALENGDMLGIDEQGRVTYLSHDGHPLHGALLGADLDAFFDAWRALAFAGPEAWQIDEFVGHDGLDPTLDASTSWRRLLGLDVP